MEIGMFFLRLPLKNAKNFRKFRNCFGKGLKNVDIIFSDQRIETNFWGEMTKKGRQMRNFPEKIWHNYFDGPRTETKFVKWSASRKRLRTAGLLSSSKDSHRMEIPDHAFLVVIQGVIKNQKRWT